MKEPGAFEREVAGWLDQARRWVDQRERFTLITILLALAPSPPAVVIAASLAGVQLYLCRRGRIPQAEQLYFCVALGIAAVNLVFTVALYRMLAEHAATLQGFWHPLGWPWWLLRQRAPLSEYIQAV